MSEEKKKTNEKNLFTELSEEEINASSVFSKPQIEHTQKKSKRDFTIAAKTAIALVVVVALVASTLLINKFFGKSEDLSSAGSDVVSEITSSGMADYAVKVTDYELEDVKSVTLKNENAEYEFYKTGEKGAEKWYIEGLDKRFINTDFTKLTVEDCAAPKASLSRDFDKDYDYGFDKPSAEFTVTLKSGKNFSMTVGEAFQNGAIIGSYLKSSLSPEKVYLLSEENTEYYTQKMVYYINKLAPTKVEQTDDNKEYFDGSVPKIDYAEFSGRNSRHEYRFQMSKRENSTIDYMMTSPYEYPANTEKVSFALSMINEDLEAEDIYYFNKNGVPADVLKSYNLDDPDATVKYKIGKDEVVVKAAQSKTDKVYYAVTVNDGPIIYKITSRSFDFLEQDPSYFAAESVLLESIDGLKTFTFEADDKSYKFDITSKKNSEGEVTNSIKYDGKTIKSDNFANYYFILMSVNPIVSETSLVQTRPEGAKKYFSVKLSHNSDISDPDIEYTIYKLSDISSRYYIEMNGKPMGLCTTEYADMLYEKIDDLVSNKTIEEI